MLASDSITSLKGIGEKTASVFHKVGISEVGQLLHYYPRNYDLIEDLSKISDLKSGQSSVVEAMICSSISERKTSKITITSFQVSDETGMLQITFFNMPYVKKMMKKGMTYCFRGKVIARGNAFVMEQPKHYSKAQYESIKGKLFPIYPLIGGLTQNLVRKVMTQVLSQLPVSEHFPEQLCQQYSLMPYDLAIRNIHFPENGTLQKLARRRLVFEEFLAFLWQIRVMKESAGTISNRFPMMEVAETKLFLEKLPFRLTDDQMSAWNQIGKELSGDYAMNRLIQGDVGSGKTMLAFLALIMTAVNGLQGALMAPTEVLASQHYQTLLEYAKAYQLPLKPVLLTGSMSGKVKKEAYLKIKEGNYNVIIGTHALFQEKVEYRNLALVVTDEQHRFGVYQREKMIHKGSFPHVMVMSATPIPRTLAMILYGDLHISVIKQMPAGRIPIKNCVVDCSYREKAYQFIAKEIKLGHQAFVICPMIEADEDSDLENVVEYTEKLRSYFPAAIQIGTIHGKMKSLEKQRIMAAFAAGEIDVLVSTTVVEVGVNVPNATVMLIENAERFGLAQLHQLRGRVGRGALQSYCIFVDVANSEKSKQRLEVLNHSNDGFYIAEQDLKLRGPGEMFGVRQSGELSFRLADIYQDAAILVEADSACQSVQKNNITLTFEESKSKLIGSGFLQII